MEHYEWVNALIERLMARSQELQESKTSHPMRDTFWTGYRIALGDLQMAALREAWDPDASEAPSNEGEGLGLRAMLESEYDDDDDDDDEQSNQSDSHVSSPVV